MNLFERPALEKILREKEGQINAFLQAAWNLCAPPIMISHKFKECNWRMIAAKLHGESTLVPDFPLDELDKGLLQRYRRICKTSRDSEHLLVARNLGEQQQEKIILNRAGVLLFAKNPGGRWYIRNHAGVSRLCLARSHL